MHGEVFPSCAPSVIFTLSSSGSWSSKMLRYYFLITTRGCKSACMSFSTGLTTTSASLRWQTDHLSANSDPQMSKLTRESLSSLRFAKAKTKTLTRRSSHWSATSARKASLVKSTQSSMRSKQVILISDRFSEFIPY